MKIKYLLITASVVVSAAVLYFTFRLWAASSGERITAGVTAHGVNVGGMTAAEAETALASRFQPDADIMKITFYEGETEAAVYTFADFGFEYNFKNAAEDAMAVGRGDIKERVAASLPWARRTEISTPPTFKADEEKIAAKLRDISKAKGFAAVNASFNYKNGAFTVVPSADGRELDIKKTAEAVWEILKSQRNGTVELSFNAVPPLHPTEEFQYEIALLGKAETFIAPDESEPRLNNISIAASRINNQVLMPGEIFSAGGKVGSGTPDGGYARAVVLVDGKPTEDFGGGVCQVVTTLYNAVLKSELDVIERHNHSVKVSYADYGFDATVAGDYFDLKFKNSTQSPLLVVSYVADGKLNVSVYGRETRAANRRVDFVSKLIETTPPEAEKITYDTTVPEDEIWVTVIAQDGYKYELYKNVYVNGGLTETVKINTSTYKPVRGAVLQAHEY